MKLRLHVVWGLFACVAIWAWASGAAAAENVRVKMETSHGDIVLSLEAEKTPVTVANFLSYVRDGLYRNTILHAVVPGFRIEGGMYNSAYQMLDPEEALFPIRNESEKGLLNERATIAMNQFAQADTATSMFFINTGDNTFLNKPENQLTQQGFTAFGRVVEGMDVIERIENLPLGFDERYPVGRVTPAESVTITTITLMDAYNWERADKLIAENKKQIEGERERVRLITERKDEAVEEALARVKQEVEERVGKPLVELNSGMWSVVVEPGDGSRKPSADDNVKVNYHGERLDGFVFDSTRGKAPLVFRVGDLIPGWVQALTDMTPGEKRVLLIPPRLGYGARALGNELPANSWLLFDIEMISIED